ncbi:MAG: hypothetical protein ACKPGK_04520 [Verrucomicrobiota bacterium]
MTLPDAIAAARAGRKVKIRCPNTQGHKHGDREASLSVFPGSNSWIGVNCFAGCNLDDVLAAAGLRIRDLGPDRPFEPGRARMPRNRPKAASEPQTAPSTPADPEKAAQRALWPRLMVPETCVLERLADRRGIPVEGLELAVTRGILRVCYHDDSATMETIPSWVVTDASRCSAQARPFTRTTWHGPDGPKALSLPGSVGRWPIGTSAIGPQHRGILFCEGGPDLLAAHALIRAEGREVDAAAVAMLGASSLIADEALEVFRGRRVRFVIHADTAGTKGLARWGAQLRGIAASRDSICFEGLHRADGQPVKDLNDALLVDADTFERARILWGVVP